MQQIRKPVEEDLQAFNWMLDQLSLNSNGLLSEILNYTFAKRGKQIRPLIVLLASRAVMGGEKLPESALQAALSIELLHTASLQHDDVVDESDLRRGQPTTHARWSNKVAVLTGDYLLAQSIHAVAATHNLLMTEAIAEVGAHLADGELIQLQRMQSNAYDEQVYYRIIENKTARLFAICARCGALAAEATLSERKALEQYGLEFGLAFQLKDDILDCTATAEQLGKPVGNDVQEHKLTLPQACGIAYAERQVQLHCQAARKALMTLCDTPARQSLLLLLDFAASRKA